MMTKMPVIEIKPDTTIFTERGRKAVEVWVDNLLLARITKDEHEARLTLVDNPGPAYSDLAMAIFKFYRSVS